MRFLTFIVALGAWFLPFIFPDEALGQPKQIIIIRHAEKPAEGPCLSLRGRQRAAALPYYFESSELFKVAPLKGVYAEYKNKPDAAVRSVDTCNEVADHFGLTVDISYHPTSAKKLAKKLFSDVAYSGATVLICWNHTDIVELINELKGTIPGSWGNETYDQLVILRYHLGDAQKEEIQLQRLLYGDRSNLNDESVLIASESSACKQPEQRKVGN